jgi:hypothetical protein
MFRAGAEQFCPIRRCSVELCRNGMQMDDTRKTSPAQRRGKGPAEGGRSPRGAGRVDPISAGLKALWAAMENEPVPDEFLALLDRIDATRPPVEPAVAPLDADPEARPNG